MIYTRIQELHSILRDPAATVDAKADAILDCVNEHHDYRDRRELLKSVLDGYVAPEDRKEN